MWLVQASRQAASALAAHVADFADVGALPRRSLSRRLYPMLSHSSTSAPATASGAAEMNVSCDAAMAETRHTRDVRRTDGLKCRLEEIRWSRPRLTLLGVLVLGTGDLSALATTLVRTRCIHPHALGLQPQLRDTHLGIQEITDL